ncbi:hypothetical protein JTB14_032169 [Gonioctena quinquepunctata]|nr:hypothetical protein JTB14_032169 [Gonioctena quinquepunctata]
MFQVPDELLDSMVCDFCHKILSVGPVKVYPNRKRRCGRCFQDGDSGVISLYKLIAGEGLFKCVNRFDGCRKLVTYAGAANHESTCNSKKYMCPICPVTREIPSFLLVKHFRDYHGDHFLDSPSFKVDATGPCTKTYLYRVRDNIFFIHCKITPVDIIALNIIFLGGKEGAQNMKQRFTVQYMEKETETKMCDFFGSENTDEFVIEKPKSKSNLVRVDFHLEIAFPEVHTLAETNISTKLKTTQLKQIIGLPRNLSLDEEFQKRHPEYTVSSKLNSVLVIGRNKNTSEYFTQCSFCKVQPLKHPYTFSSSGLGKLHYICSCCRKFESDVRIFRLNEELCSFLYYSCIWRPWGCSESHQSFKIANHEMSCSHQPTRKCPVLQCNYTGKSLELLDHLRKYHREQPIMVPYSYNPGRPSANSSEIWYIWAYYDFVSMEVKRNDSKHLMRIVPVEEKASGSPESIVVISDFSGKIVESIRITQPCHETIEDEVHIDAFFMKSRIYRSTSKDHQN